MTKNSYLVLLKNIFSCTFLVVRLVGYLITIVIFNTTQLFVSLTVVKSMFLQTDASLCREKVYYREYCQIPLFNIELWFVSAQYIMPTCNGSVRWKYTLGLLLKVGSTLVYTLPSSGRTITPVESLLIRNFS